MPEQQSTERPLWQQIQPGGIGVNPGSTERGQTGDWRTEVPVIDFERCTHCMICCVDCPDASFEVANAKLIAVDLKHCKGCGICAQVCPVKCIEMVPDSAENRETTDVNSGNGASSESAR